MCVGRQRRWRRSVRRRAAKQSARGFVRPVRGGRGRLGRSRLEVRRTSVDALVLQRSRGVRPWRMGAPRVRAGWSLFDEKRRSVALRALGLCGIATERRSIGDAHDTVPRRCGPDRGRRPGRSAGDGHARRHVPRSRGDRGAVVVFGPRQRGGRVGRATMADARRSAVVVFEARSGRAIARASRARRRRTRARRAGCSVSLRRSDLV